jgi:hypothetical protein
MKNFTAAEEAAVCFEEGRNGRALLPLSSQYEGCA